jgi:hypothetical protein
VGAAFRFFPSVRAHTLVSRLGSPLTRQTSPSQTVGDSLLHLGSVSFFKKTMPIAEYVDMTDFETIPQTATPEDPPGTAIPTRSHFGKWLSLRNGFPLSIRPLELVGNDTMSSFAFAFQASRIG